MMGETAACRVGHRRRDTQPLGKDDIATRHPRTHPIRPGVDHARDPEISARTGILGGDGESRVRTKEAVPGPLTAKVA